MYCNVLYIVGCCVGLHESPHEFQLSGILFLNYYVL